MQQREEEYFLQQRHYSMSMERASPDNGLLYRWTFTERKKFIWLRVWDLSLD